MDHASATNLLQTEIIRTTISEHYKLFLEIPTLQSKNEYEIYVESQSLKTFEGPNALHFLHLLGQKLEGMECNKKADEQLVYIAERFMSTDKRFASLQIISKPKNSTDWITNNFLKSHRQTR